MSNGLKEKNDHRLDIMEKHVKAMEKEANVIPLEQLPTTLEYNAYPTEEDQRIDTIKKRLENIKHGKKINKHEMHAVPMPAPHFLQENFVDKMSTVDGMSTNKFDMGNSYDQLRKLSDADYKPKSSEDRQKDVAKRLDSLDAQIKAVGATHKTKDKIALNVKEHDPAHGSELTFSNSANNNLITI